MGMTGANPSATVRDINVTPLIDVLLVLLIIFMVIVPVAPKGLDALIPQPSKVHPTPETPERTVVVQVLAGADGITAYRINDDPIAKLEIQPKLTQVFAQRQDKVMFVRADGALDYSKVAEVIDFAKSAGVESIGVLTAHSGQLR